MNKKLECIYGRIKKFLCTRLIAKLIFSILLLPFIYLPDNTFPTSSIRPYKFYIILFIHCIAIFLILYILLSAFIYLLDRLKIKSEILKKLIVASAFIFIVIWPFRESIYLGGLGLIFSSDGYGGESNSSRYMELWSNHCRNKNRCNQSGICRNAPMDCMAGCVDNCVPYTHKPRITPNNVFFKRIMTTYKHLDKQKVDPECRWSGSWERHGIFYINDDNVCLRTRRYYSNIDGKSFEYINHTYAKDKNYIYVFDSFRDEYGAKAQILEADLETFEPLNDYTVYAKDKNNVYACGRIIIDADVNTFEIISGDFARDKNYVYKESRKHSELRIPNCAVGKITNVDPKTFNLEQYIKKNKNNFEENNLMLYL